MPDLNDTSILQDADALAEASARAQRDGAEIKARDAGGPGAGLKPSVDLNDEAGAGLDKALAEVQADPDAQVSEPANPLAPAKAAPKPAEPAAPAADPKPDEPANPLDQLLKAATAEPAAPAPAPEKKDPYADHQLPANASKASREHFDRMKAAASADVQAATERATAAETKLAELDAQVKELQAKTTTLDPAIEAELKSLREHRALFDTANDPAFQQKFDGRISQNYETIYKELGRHGLPEGELAKLKAFPRQQRDAAIEGFLKQLDGDDAALASRRLIEAKLVANFGVEDERNTELQATKAKADQIVKQSAAQPEAARKAAVDAAANIVAPKLKGLDFIWPKKIDAGTPPELKKQLEEHNVFALQLQDELKSALVNDDPETRATAALSVPLARFFARELAKTQASLKEANDKLARYAKAGATSRLADRAAPRSDVPVKPASLAAEDAGDAVDQLFTAATGKPAV